MDASDPGQSKTPDFADLSTVEALAPSVPARTFDAGRIFGSYRLIRPLGRGGFGDVWDAESVITGRRLALKVLTATRSPSFELLERFKREGRLIGSLNHPRCVFAFGAEEIDGYPTIAMELMSGGTLQDRLAKHGPIPSREAVDLILDVIEGLEAAQRAGILHRDIKPSNCFVDEADRCKIGDFGISKSFQAPADLTLTGGFIGTPSYASPEQVRGRELDFRSDIYSTGATLYAIVTGRPPFQGGTAGEVLARIMGEDPTPFSNHPVDVPPGLQRVILRAMSKDKDKRFKNYSDLRAALLPFSSHGLTAASLFARFVAYQIDGLLLTSGNLAIPYLGLPPLVWVGPLFLYFAFTELVWGRSLGKYMLKLRVTTTAGASLTFRHAVLRTAMWSGFLLTPTLAVLVLPPIGASSALLALLLPAVFVTARARNGYAGVHEVLSGTRVMTLTARDARRVPVVGLPVAKSQGLQLQRRGPYMVVGILWQSETQMLLIGHDELLGRTVWILDHTVESSDPMEALTAVRPGRLRWLQGSRDGPRHWDAYEAPAGIGLVEWVADKGRLSWQHMRDILRDVTTEINAQIVQGYVSRSLSVTRLWIDSHGTSRLLDFPAPRSDGHPTAGFTTFQWQDWAFFLQDLTYFVLAGRLRPHTGFGAGTPRVPMPEHARALVNRICSVPEKLASPVELIEELRRTADRPARLTRLRRAGPAAVITAPYLVVLAGMLLSLFVFTLLSPPNTRWMEDLINAPFYQETLINISNERVESNKQAAEALRKVLANSYTQAQLTPEGRQLLSAFSPDVRRELQAAARRYPQLSETDVAEARKALPLAPSLATRFRQGIAGMIGWTWLVSAFVALLMAAILGTGPLFRVFQMSLQTRDGRKAGRLRCLIRAVVAWPSIPPFAISMVAPVFGIPRVEPTPELLLWTVAIAVGGLIYNLITPERGIPDIIAGTYLVPS